MLIAFHVTVALAGILSSTLAVFYPSRLRIRLSSVLIALTIASGFYLVWTTRTHILQTCISGLVYLGLTSGALVLASVRLRADVDQASGK